MAVDDRYCQTEFPDICLVQRVSLEEYLRDLDEHLKELIIVSEYFNNAVGNLCDDLIDDTIEMIDENNKGWVRLEMPSEFKTLKDECANVRKDVTNLINVYIQNVDKLLKEIDETNLTKEEGPVSARTEGSNRLEDNLAMLLKVIDVYTVIKDDVQEKNEETVTENMFDILTMALGRTSMVHGALTQKPKSFREIIRNIKEELYKTGMAVLDDLSLSHESLRRSQMSFMEVVKGDHVAYDMTTEQEAAKLAVVQNKLDRMKETEEKLKALKIRVKQMKQQHINKTS